jgi:ABC-2 type transport system ATP-binding protein
VFDIAKQRLQRLATFSKGMRQKILIAAALLHDPAILLLDEPLTGLDVSSSAMVKDLLGALAREGKTILYSSHVLDVVERVCNRVLIIHQGNLIADDTLESLKEQTKGDTLEEVFRQLTHTAATGPLLARVMQAMKL